MELNPSELSLICEALDFKIDDLIASADDSEWSAATVGLAIDSYRAVLERVDAEWDRRTAVTTTTNHV